MASRVRTSEKAPNPQRMADLFDQCGIPLKRRQIDQLWIYHGLLRRHNQLLNLTRIHNFTNMVLKLYVDSVLPGRITELSSPLMDLGTGPGMPGIPLKIMHPELEIWLAESRSRRVAFLREVVDALDLTGMHLIDAKITPKYAEPMAGVISRAVESIGETLERIKGCLQQGGRVIFMKGPGCDAEIEAWRSGHQSGYELIQDTAYRIGQTLHQRRLVVFKRLDRPPRLIAETACQRHRTLMLTSESNTHFKALKKLLVARGVRKMKQALVTGAKLVAETIANYPGCCLMWISVGDQSPPPSTAPADMTWLQLPVSLFAQLDIFGTRSPLLVIAVPSIDRWHPQTGLPPGCSLLIPFQDPENVGAVIRTAAAFGVDQVILLAESAHPYHPKALRAAGGVTPGIKLLQGPPLKELSADLPILALSADGIALENAQFSGTFGFLAGLEGQGLPEQWRSRAVRIPIEPGVESLNAAVSVGIALYEWRRRISAHPKNH